MFSREEKLKILSMLNWDYNVSPEDMLAVIEGKLDVAGPFTRERIFLRSLERLPWHRISGLWGADLSERMLTTDIIRKIWPESRRGQLERLEKILHGKPVPPAEWGAELRKKLRNTVFSNRWYCSKPGLF